MEIKIKVFLLQLSSVQETFAVTENSPSTPCSVCPDQNTDILGVPSSRSLVLYQNNCYDLPVQILHILEITFFFLLTKPI